MDTSESIAFAARGAHLSTLSRIYGNAVAALVERAAQDGIIVTVTECPDPTRPPAMGRMLLRTSARLDAAIYRPLMAEEAAGAPITWTQKGLAP